MEVIFPLKILFLVVYGVLLDLSTILQKPFGQQYQGWETGIQRVPLLEELWFYPPVEKEFLNNGFIHENQ